MCVQRTRRRLSKKDEEVKKNKKKQMASGVLLVEPMCIRWTYSSVSFFVSFICTRWLPCWLYTTLYTLRKSYQTLGDVISSCTSTKTMSWFVSCVPLPPANLESATHWPIAGTAGGQGGGVGKERA